MHGTNRESLGFDMWTDPVQRATMERARDSGQPTLSAKVGASTPIDKGLSGGFIVYVPIYHTGAPIQTVEERRQALVGFVFSPIQPVTLFSDIVDDMPPVAFEVYDGALPQPAALLHRSAEQTGSRTGTLGYQSTRLVHVAGREWLMILTSLGGAVVGFPPAARWTLISGLLLSLMLFVTTSVQVDAWESAARHQIVLEASERALRESEAQLRDLVVREREARHPGPGGGPFERRVSGRAVARTAYTAQCGIGMALNAAERIAARKSDAATRWMSSIGMRVFRPT